MGLDMFLVLDKGRKGTAEVERYWNSAEHWDKVLKLKVGEFDGLVLAQWRKAFGILNWFDHSLASVAEVNRELPDEDFDELRDRNCVQYGHYYKVTEEELSKLVSLCGCVKLLAEEYGGRSGVPASDIPESLSPIGKGYFIGATDEINDWWWEDIDSTLRMLESVSDHIDWDNDDAYFCIG